MELPDSLVNNSVELREELPKKSNIFKKLFNNLGSKNLFLAIFIIIMGLLGIVIFLYSSGKLSIFSFAKEDPSKPPIVIQKNEEESPLSRFFNSHKNAASTKIRPSPTPTQITPSSLVQKPTFIPTATQKPPTATNKPTKPPSATPQTTPTVTPTVTLQPTTTPIPNPPTMEILYPSEGQYIELTSAQTLCVVDRPTGYTSGLQKRKNVNNTGWTSYATPDGTCFDPLEGQNTFSFQYKNSQEIESVVYTRTFTFHRL